MAHFLLVNGKPLLRNTVSSLVVPDWGDVINWTHAWDMKDITTYQDPGIVGLGIPAATRVAAIRDRGSGNLPLLKDSGPWGSIISYQALPGPRYIASSARFNGRPASNQDLLYDSGGVFDIASMLSPNSSPGDSSTWFNAPNGYPMPYWCAILCRNPNGQTGGAVDAQQGGLGTFVTLGKGLAPGSPKYWSVTNSVIPGDPWPSTPVAMSSDQTVLVICKAAGASSFVEINWKDGSGIMQTNRTNLTLANHSAKELFFGYVHTSYVTAAGIVTASPTEPEIDAVRAWAAPWMPPTGSLVFE